MNAVDSLNVEVEGDLRWGGYFIPMVPLSQLQVGYFGGLTARNIGRVLMGTPRKRS
jgi:hypothetical protein